MVAAPASIARSALGTSSPVHATGSRAPTGARVQPADGQASQPVSSERSSSRSISCSIPSSSARSADALGSSPPNRPCSTGSKNSIAFGAERPVRARCLQEVDRRRGQAAELDLARDLLDQLVALLVADSRDSSALGSLTVVIDLLLPASSAMERVRTWRGTDAAWYTRGSRAARLVTTSQEFVPRAAATSAAVICSPPCDPMSTNSSWTVTGSPGHVRDVGHDRVHRHVADKRHAHAPDERFGAIREGSRPAVAVAERQRGDAARPGRGERRAVADAPARGQVGDADGARVKRQDRPEPGRAPTDVAGEAPAATLPAARPGRARRSRGPGARRPSADDPVQQEPAARRDVPRRHPDARPAAELGCRGASKRSSCAAVRGCVLRRLEVRPQAREPRRPGRLDRPRGGDEVGSGEAATTQAGLDLELQVERGATPALVRRRRRGAAVEQARRRRP